MNVQACSRCGYGVYPAEKISCIDQTWHKACFHCEVCKMMLSVNNFVSHQKKPYCHAHNPKNNTFTSVYHTPLNLTLKKPVAATGGVNGQENDGKQAESVFHWDMKSKDGAGAPSRQPLLSEAGPHASVVLQQGYTEDCEQQQGKGSFPAMITPAYQRAKTANQLASQVQYKRGHDERVSTFTPVADTPELLRARAGGQLQSDVRYTEDCGAPRGKGSFPAMITPAYQIAKRASELASDVYSEECDEPRGKGSFPAMITPAYQNAKKANELVSDVNGQENDGKQAESVFHWDMKSKDGAGAPSRQPLLSEAGPHASVVLQQGYTEDCEQQQGKGSFPAMITPAYQRAKTANQLASQVQYKRGHDERVSTFTPVADTPELLRARAGGQLQSDVRYTEDCGAPRGKGSFPAMITPAYQIAKRASELASDVRYHQQYQREMKGKASSVGAEGGVTKGCSDQYGQVYSEECDEPRGKGSFPAMITPAYQNAKKANELVSDIKYSQDFRKMKGAAHFHSLPAQDNLVLKRAQSVNKLVSEVEYKKDLEGIRGHSINYCETPQFRNVSKISKFTSDNKYKEKYQTHLRGHYEGVGMDRRMLHALKVGSLASNVAYKADYKHDIVDYNYPATLTPSYQTTMKLVPLKEVNYRQSIDKLKYSSVTDTPQIVQAKINAQQLSHANYRADYERNKLNYTLPQDVPQLLKAKSNAKLFSEVKYKEGWQKTKGRGFEMKLDSMSLLAAKASGELASNIKYKEEYEKAKGRALGTTDSKLLHSLQVAKINSELQYKADLAWMKGVGWLTEGSLNLEQAKKAGQLVSEKNYRQRADELKFTSVTDSSQMEHAKKSQELQSEVAYKAGNEQSIHQYSISKDEPFFLQARANAAQLSETLYKSSWERQKAKGFELRLDSLTFLTAKARRDLASENQYRADVKWMKGTGWVATGSLNVEQAKKAGELISEKKYRQHPDALKFTSIKDTPEMVQARISYTQAVDRLYREQGESIKHHYTQTVDLPEVLLAKLNAMNISETRYKESWSRLRDGGYKLRLDALPFQAAKVSSDIISDYKYKEAFERMKGQMLGSRGLEDDLSLAHAVHATSLQSGVNYKKAFEHSKTHFHLPLDMVTLVHAKKAQNLASGQDYRHPLPQHTSLAEDLRLSCAKKAHKLQSENLYRSDLNFMRGVPCVIPGTLEIEGRKKASELISESKYRQHPGSFKYTAVTDTPGLLHAKFSNQITNERLYKAAGEDARHQYTMTLGLPEFSRAKANADNLSEAKYKESWHNLRAQGYKLTIDALPFQAARASGDIASDFLYRYDFVKERGRLIGVRSASDDPRLRHCQRMGQLQSENQYKKEAAQSQAQCHLPMDMVHLVHARKAQALASDHDYRTQCHEFTALPEDLKMAWAKKAHALQSEFRYRSDLMGMKGTGWLALRSPQMESAKKAGELISETKYREKPDSIKFTTVVDSPDLLHAKNSYLHCNEKVYRNSWEQNRAGGYDFRLDAIPFQTAKASRDIASDVKYKSDLNLTRGVGWTPPGSYKVEMARRAAELANRRGLGIRGAYGGPEEVGHGDHQSREVNPDASEILHINRRKTLLM
ncbi:Nebulin-related-anchoring protein [Microtus ochrogaster]|uniref:Nebulin-related-anchoring protein n=1 Tax=Microtus ochrogaster TaxID=79684 RepID=A0A8J6G8L7_MICOH|nr:Nebulin-related-anchoring protein [Microtus ochrogaster]